MTTVDLSNLGGTFRLDSGFQFDSFLASGPDFYSFETTIGHTVVVRGSGIDTLDTVPISGTITEVEIELNGSDPLNTDILITGLDDVPIVDLDITSANPTASTFWEGVLDGDVTVVGGDGGRTDEFRFAADTSGHEDGLLTGNDNFISGVFDGRSYLYGSSQDVTDGLLIGGSLTFDGEALLVSGDVDFTRNAAVVIGGDDSITMSGDRDLAVLLGDADTLRDESKVIGGNDFLDARQFEGANVDLYGEAFSVRDSAILVGGDDTIYGSDNADTLSEIWGDARSANTADFDAGDDLIFGGASNAIIYGDWESGGTGDATGGNDTIYSGTGNNSIYGGGGRDRIFVADDSTGFVNAGDDGDLVRVDADEVTAVTIAGDDGIDRISFFATEDGINVDMEDQFFEGGATVGNVTFSGFENMTGSNGGDDRITTVLGQANNIDTLAGDDVVISQGYGDDINLGSGSDLVKAGREGNTYEGGSGLDTITYSASDDGVRVDLRDNEASGGFAEGDVISGFERVNGSRVGEDLLLGTDRGNVIKGLDGDDRLSGRDGNDKMYGGDDDDYLDGGAGRDSLFGGDGVDTFHIDKGHDVDIIADFENNVDRIELDVSASFDWRDNATQRSDGVLINLGDGDLVLVEGALIGQLTNDLFIV